MKAQHGDAPLVFFLRVELAETPLVRDHLAAGVEIDERAVVPARLAFHFRPIYVAGEAERRADRAEARHGASAAPRHVIAAREAELARERLVVAHPRRVSVHGRNAVLVV